MPAGEIDDAQAARSHAEVGLYEYPLVIRASMAKGVTTRAQALGAHGGSVRQVQHADDAAHVLTFLGAARKKQNVEG